MDNEMREFADHALHEMFPKLKASAMSVTLIPNGPGDVKLWVEMGAAIMLNKPIIVVLCGDAPLPPKLALIADDVVRMVTPEDVEGQADMQAAIERVLSEMHDD